MLCEKARRKLPRLGCNGALDQNRLSGASSLPPQLSVGDYKHAREQRLKLSFAHTFVDSFSAFCAERVLSSYLQALCRLLSYRRGLCTFLYQRPSERRPDTLPLFTSFVWAAPDWGWQNAIFTRTHLLQAGSGSLPMFHWVAIPILKGNSQRTHKTIKATVFCGRPSLPHRQGVCSSSNGTRVEKCAVSFRQTTQHDATATLYTLYRRCYSLSIIQAVRIHLVNLGRQHISHRQWKRQRSPATPSKALSALRVHCSLPSHLFTSTGLLHFKSTPINVLVTRICCMLTMHLRPSHTAA